MTNLTPQQIAGKNLRKFIISAKYKSQEDFAFEYGADIRTINRYINDGINKIDAIQNLAQYLHVSFMDFFVEDEE